MKKFEYKINSMSARHGVSRVFSDFLTLTICAFSMGRQEKLYMETISHYSKNEAMLFSEALSALVIEMSSNGVGFIDVLGEFFQQNISMGHNGQFFSPMHICELMVQLQSPFTENTSVCDPACGSGRMLMAAAKYNRQGIYYGADNDAVCAKMAVINLCLNQMQGEIAWMNTLTNQYYGGWQIIRSVKGIPVIKTVSEKQSYIHLKLPEKREISNRQMVFEF